MNDAKMLTKYEVYQDVVSTIDNYERYPCDMTVEEMYEVLKEVADWLED